MDLYRGQVTPWQEKVISILGKVPYIVLAVGRKGRKTTLDINELIFSALSDPRELTYAFIGPTRVQAKKIAWDDHVAKILRVLKSAGVPHEINKSDLSISFPGYGKFAIDGGDNLESLRGKSDWGGIVLDEFASWRNKRYAWEEVIEPNLIVNHAWAIISGTPQGYDYFHALMKMGDHKNTIEGEAYDEEGQLIKPDNDFISFRFSSYDNPWLDHDWIDKKKNRLTQSAFNREYLARFEKYSGLVYQNFERKTHIVEPFDVPLTWQFYRGMDFGATNPTVCLWFAVDPNDNIYLIEEYYNTAQNSEFHVNVINSKTKTNWPIITTYGDPSAKQEMLDYATHGIPISPALRIVEGDEKGWVNKGIERVGELLKPDRLTHRPKLYIFSNCVNTIREFESYRWLDKKVDGVDREQVLKVDDHCMDALRYFVTSFSLSHKPREEWMEEQSYSQQNSFTGYSKVV